MSATYKCADQESMGAAIDHAARVMADGECIVMPTDTVYGIGCDAFSPMGVQTLLGAKGRTRQMPPPVLIANPGVMAGLADQVSDAARALADAFWPGALTLVCWAQPTLGWDLGETHGTVALRVPDDLVARQLLERVGPMAVSSANLTGMSAALTAQDAREMLQDRVALYLDDGARPTAEHEADNPNGLPSTIVDCTGEVPVVLRLGAIGLAELRAVVPDVDAGDFASNDPSDQSGERHNHGAAGTRPAGATGAGSSPVAPEETEAEPSVEPSRHHTDVGGRSTRRSTAEPLVEPGATEAEVARALVQNAAAGPGARVDQNRHRANASRPGWGGTEALSVAEAGRLVNGG
ncbi:MULTISPECIES: L-threonylcarbamoyladenylate synthase [unclassified Candidatus Sulfotelmatobacter]|uniref:L-threonylcarbamoyladenylate synthase n=1 Tax=unclassified Candidatus Sulfotelmatobacter TaxID=2635724 RepID=UPI002A4E2650|nr:L-threonylcarbamoyladenylate synthase [Kocuria sp. cx-116]